jgi:hypothetical protein
MAESFLPFSRLPVRSGVMIGVAPLPFHLVVSPELSYELAAITLVLIAGVYIGYAFKDGRASSILIELPTALAFSGAAWAGMNGYPSLIIAALALHGLWDLLHHNVVKTEIPRWYIPFCAATDWVMAACLFFIWNIV